ncbi:MAG TPA: glycosyltransferase family 2 protein [Solirubrobacteraceae bacterium]
MPAAVITPSERTDRPAPMTRLSSLSIVLPCFNEEENVANAIAEASIAARRVADAHEIIVVDDGSSDRTRVVAGSIALADGDVRVVAHEHNRGYGAAVRSGFQAARMDWILLTDGDLQFDLAELADVTPLTAGADFVAGYRIVRMDPLHRRVNAAAWNWLVRRFFDVDLRDVDCAFKLMRRTLIQSLDLTAEGAMVSTELVAKAAGHGARFAEAGVHHRPRVAGASSGASPRVIARAFGELFRISRDMRSQSAVAPQLQAPQTTALGA